MKVIIVGGNAQYVELVKSCPSLELAPSYEEADVVMFTGGADVDPSMYGEEKHPATHSNLYRDKQEKYLYDKALAEGKKFVGICRGGQFLNVMNGGSMYQHINNHATGMLHPIQTIDGKKVMVTSTHHQMMRPHKSGELLAWVEGLATLKQTADSSHEDPIDVEVVWYEETNSLCFQPHPEFAGSSVDDCRNYFYELVEKYLCS